MTALNSATDAAEAADAHRIQSAPARVQYTSLTRLSFLGSFQNRLRHRTLPDANARELTFSVSLPGKFTRKLNGTNLCSFFYAHLGITQRGVTNRYTPLSWRVVRAWTTRYGISHFQHGGPKVAFPT